MDDIWRDYASFLETHSNCHSSIPLSLKVTRTPNLGAQLTKLIGRKLEQTFSEHQLNTAVPLYLEGIHSKTPADA